MQSKYLVLIEKEVFQLLASLWHASLIPCQILILGAYNRLQHIVRTQRVGHVVYTEVRSGHVRASLQVLQK